VPHKVGAGAKGRDRPALGDGVRLAKGEFQVHAQPFKLVRPPLSLYHHQLLLVRHALGLHHLLHLLEPRGHLLLLLEEERDVMLARRLLGCRRHPRLPRRLPSG